MDMDNNSETITLVDENSWSCCGNTQARSTGCSWMHSGKYAITKDHFGFSSKQKWSCCDNRDASSIGCVKYHTGYPPLITFSTSWRVIAKVASEASVKARQTVANGGFGDGVSLEVKQFDGGNLFEGELWSGKMHGLGVYRWLAGHIYQGQWFEGRRQGLGVLLSANGDVYEGSWELDKRHGLGIIRYSFGDSYSGSWTNNRRDGEGYLDMKDGGVYEGSFKDGKMSGIGWQQSPGGGSYEGEFLNDRKHGLGIYRYTSGAVYEGGWENGEKHGHGKIWYPDGRIVVGEWCNGNESYISDIVDGSSPPPRQERFRRKSISPLHIPQSVTAQIARPVPTNIVAEESADTTGSIANQMIDSAISQRNGTVDDNQKGDDSANGGDDDVCDNEESVDDENLDVAWSRVDKVVSIGQPACEEMTGDINRSESESFNNSGGIDKFDEAIDDNFSAVLRDSENWSSKGITDLASIKQNRGSGSLPFLNSLDLVGNEVDKDGIPHTSRSHRTNNSEGSVKSRFSLSSTSSAIQSFMSVTSNFFNIGNRIETIDEDEDEFDDDHKLIPITKEMTFTEKRTAVELNRLRSYQQQHRYQYWEDRRRALVGLPFPRHPSDAADMRLAMSSSAGSGPPGPLCRGRILRDPKIDRDEVKRFKVMQKTLKRNFIKSSVLTASGRRLLLPLKPKVLPVGFQDMLDGAGDDGGAGDGEASAGRGQPSGGDEGGHARNQGDQADSNSFSVTRETLD